MGANASRQLLSAMLVTCASAAVAAPLKTYTTRHYRLLTDVDTELASDLARRLDAMHDEYARRLALFGADAASEPMDAYVFEKQADYAQLTGNRFRNSGGVFMPARKLLAAYVELQGRDATRRTLQHEAFHQFAFAHVSKSLPPWANEGLAQLFEESVWTGDGFTVGELPPRRLRQLRDDLAAGRIVPSKKLLDLDDAGWAAGFDDVQKLGVQYNQAWALVHFLVYAAGDDGQPRFRSRFIAFLRAVNEGVAPAEAWTTQFGNNYDGLDARFREWASVARATPLAAAMERQSVLADMLVLLKQRGETVNSYAELEDKLRTTRLRVDYTRGQMRWSTDADPMVYLRDNAGRSLGASRCRFERRDPSVLPDLVIQSEPGLLIRTRFRRSGQAIEHETGVTSD